MSAKISDFNDLAYFPAATTASGLMTASYTGPAIDMQTCANNNVALFVNIFSVQGTAPVYTIAVQESPTTTAASFTAVATNLGTTIGTVSTTGTSTTGANIVLVQNFQRTQPFVRFNLTISGTTSGIVADPVFIGQRGQLP